MSHEKRTLAELMQENDEKESFKKESPAPAAKQSENEKLPPSRQGKSRLETWVSRETKKQLRLLAIEEEKTQDQLLRDGLNLLFRSHGRPPIA